MRLDILNGCPDFIRDFLTYNEIIRGKSSKSVEQYYSDLRTFFRYILLVRGKAPQGTPFNKIDISGADIELVRSVTVSDLYGFMVYCKEELRNNPATRARKTSTLRLFFKYMSVQTHRLDSNPADLLEAPKIKQSLPKYLSLEDSLELLNSVDGENERRDYCILTIFLNCGLRLSELCGLDLSDISSDGTMTVTGKGNKERMVYLNDSCKTAIKRYLEVRPHEGLTAESKNALFISRNRKRISPRTVEHIVTSYIKKAGLDGKGLSTHKLRHTAATLMYNEGHVDVRTLMDVLGHEQLTTTQIYTHLSDRKLEEAAEANPLADIKK